MKLALASDVHLEFGDLVLDNTDDADVLILGGDIFVAKDLLYRDHSGMKLPGLNKSERIHRFMQDMCDKFKDVIYIMGNHEHYHGDFANTLTDIRLKLGYLENLHILEKETITIGDITFIGGTLWTDMNHRDPMTLLHIKSGMNDFGCIRNSNRMTTRQVPIYEYDTDGKMKLDQNGYSIKIGMKFKEEPSKFSPEDAVDDHEKMMAYIKTVIEGKHDQKFVVVGHHTPSHLSIHPRYRHDALMNGGYASDLSEFIMDHPQIKLWTHGHTHDTFDYVLGETRIVCNPRGYIGHEPRANQFRLKYMEV